MANPTWPVSLPQNPYAEGDPKYTPASNVVRTPMEAGPPKMRRRFTARYATLEFTLVLSRAQRNTLDTFYNTTLDCVLPFDWTDFRTGNAGTYRFLSQPIETYHGGDGEWWKVKIALELMP